MTGLMVRATNQAASASEESSVSSNQTITTTSQLSTDVIDLLQEMGLTRHEVSIYEYLLASQSATPSAIARDIGQPRGRIYEAMRNLGAKGFARERPTRPIEFYPTPISDVLASAQVKLQRRLDTAKNAMAANASAAAQPEQVSVPRMKMRDVSVISGRRACWSEISRMMANATQYVWIVGGGRFAERLANMPTFVSQAYAALARGVDVQIMFPASTVSADTRAVMQIGGSMSPFYALAVDATGSMVSCATERGSLDVIVQPDDAIPDRGDDVAVHIAHEAFGQLQRRRTEILRQPRPANPNAP